MAALKGIDMRDKLLSMGSFDAQQSAFALLDKLQRLPKHKQIMAASLTFLLLCKQTKMNPREALELAERVLVDCLSKGRGDHIRALKNYIDKEL